MTKKEKKELAELLKKSIIDTDKMFTTKSKEHAHIIGYLQGTIKAVIRELEE
jgi:hypothetical protein